MSDRKFFDELRGAAPLISVGVLTADMMSLGSELELIEKAGVKLLHIDVMDGRDGRLLLPEDDGWSPLHQGDKKSTL